MPEGGQVCTTGYTAWNGADEITAATGQKIVVAEVDDKNRCIAAGMATVTSNAGE